MSKKGVSNISSIDVLQDTFGRSFPYLRLSITDVCNFRCSYCLPDGYQCSSKPNLFLQAHEIQNLIAAFTELGTHKIRLTGGEPTLRKDFCQIARLIAAHPGITQLAVTTNGYRLKSNVNHWHESGITHINISIDSLDAQRFCAITGHNRLTEILHGVDTALSVGFKQVKINIVLLKGINDHELTNYLAWIKDSPISIRFIELMQTGDNSTYFKKYHLSATTIENELLAQGWTKLTRSLTAGPAQEYGHPNYSGTIGLIAPYSKDFCKGCNRLRITAQGELRLCLFGNEGISLRHLLQQPKQKPILKQLIVSQLKYKDSSHFLNQGDTGVTPHLASIGG